MAGHVDQHPARVSLFVALAAAILMPTSTADDAADAVTSLAEVEREVLVAVDTDTRLSTFDVRFASITFDIQNFIGFKIYPWTYDWANLQLRAMVTALAPMTCLLYTSPSPRDS